MNEKLQKIREDGLAAVASAKNEIELQEIKEIGRAHV